MVEQSQRGHQELTIQIDRQHWAQNTEQKKQRIWTTQKMGLNPGAQKGYQCLSFIRPSLSY